MREITVSELSKILKEHKRWCDKKEGEKANLSRANLRFANLSESDLFGANLSTTQRYAHHCPDSLRDGVEILESDYNLTTVKEKGLQNMS